MSHPTVLAALACAAVSASLQLPAQNHVVGWGYTYFDSRSVGGGYVKIAAAPGASLQLRQDGSLHLRGGLAYPAPDLPPLVRYVDCAGGYMSIFAAVRSDGEIVKWGQPMLNPATGREDPIPPLPTGLRYIQVVIGLLTMAALRSDGELVVWGQDSGTLYAPPTRPANTVFTKISGGTMHFAALTGDGRVFDWGLQGSYAIQVPALPTGVTYTDIAAGSWHSLYLRSDGGVEGVGDNSYGQSSVPPLPPGLRYTFVAAGDTHSIVGRSDGVLLAFGDNTYGQCNVLPPPAGTTYTAAAAVWHHSLALCADGRVVGWGSNSCTEARIPPIPYGALLQSVMCTEGHRGFLASDGSLTDFGLAWMPPAPALPLGVTYREGYAGYAHMLALRSDGRLVAWGANNLGQCNVPNLPFGISFVKADAGYSHSVALRSDGQAMIFGTPGTVSQIPTPPAGITYTDVSAFVTATLLVRSDGTLVALASSNGGRETPPLPPPGRKFRRASIGGTLGVGLLDDGTAVSWGSTGGMRTVPEPPLPPGVVYVDARCGDNWILARRSDGSVVHWGNADASQDRIPELPPGMSCLAIDVGRIWDSAAVYGPRSTYVRSAVGCAGSLPATRLIPWDTPRIGKTLEVQLLDLPADCAFLAFGWTQVQPLSLAGLGMPACTASVAIDNVRLLTGSGRTALFRLPIPFATNLLGLQFHNQAFVPDPNAANPLRAVVSDAATAVIGG